MVVIFVGDTVATQVEEPITSTSAEDSFVQAPAEKTLAVKSVLEIVTLEAITVSTPEAAVVTSEMRQFLTELAPVLLGGMSAPPSTFKSTTTSIVETGLGSALTVSSLVIDILEELTLQMIEQFFTMMKYCTELVLSG